MEFQYQHVACGGTFDLLHKGHRAFLLLAFKNAEFVTIGVTTDVFNKKLKKTPFQNYDQRRKELLYFLKLKEMDKRSKIMPLYDIYGTTLTDKTIEALVASKETLDGAVEINKTRIQRELVRLPLIICPRVLAQDNKILSSTRIRDGIIDRNGQSYSMFLNGVANKALANKIRKRLKKPLGPLVKITKAYASKNPPSIAIGDMTVATFLKNKTVPKISIIDLVVNRQKKYDCPTQLGFENKNVDFTLKNPAGVITQQLVQIMKKAIKEKRQKLVIRVIGEEDLATIPAILLSPLGYSIYYGQPALGTIKVTVDEKIKQDICGILL